MDSTSCTCHNRNRLPGYICRNAASRNTYRPHHRISHGGDRTWVIDCCFNANKSRSRNLWNSAPDSSGDTSCYIGSYWGIFAGRQRQARSVPRLQALKERLLAIRQQVIPGGTLAKACDYTLNQWNRLEVYLEDGRVEIDNNWCYAVRGITPVMPPRVLCRVANRAARDYGGFGRLRRGTFGIITSFPRTPAAGLLGGNAWVIRCSFQPDPAPFPSVPYRHGDTFE